MRPLASDEIRGTWGTLLLPIEVDDSIDFVRLAEEVASLVASGVDGIYSNGTAGEFYAQSEDEFDRINVLMAERCEKASLPFQIGAGHMSAQVCLSRVKRAAQMRPGAVQIVLPDWYPVTVDEAIDFLDQVARVADPVGLVLYNPPHAKRILKPGDYARICQRIPTMIGLKIAGGDSAWYSAMQAAAPELSVFVPGHELATGWLLGAAGSYSNVACLEPVGAKRWNNLMVSDPGAALEIEKRIQNFLSRHILPFRERGYSNQALDKLLAAIGAWTDVGMRLRWPYRGIDSEQATRLRPVAREELPELFTTAEVPV